MSLAGKGYAEIDEPVMAMAQRHCNPLYRSPPVFAASCMCIRPVLRAVTIPSDGSTDLTESEGKTHLKKGIGRPP